MSFCLSALFYLMDTWPPWVWPPVCDIALLPSFDLTDATRCRFQFTKRGFLMPNPKGNVLLFEIWRHLSGQFLVRAVYHHSITPSFVVLLRSTGPLRPDQVRGAISSPASHQGLAEPSVERRRSVLRPAASHFQDSGTGIWLLLTPWDLDSVGAQGTSGRETRTEEKNQTTEWSLRRNGASIRPIESILPGHVWVWHRFSTKTPALQRFELDGRSWFFFVHVHAVCWLVNWD